MKVLDRKKRRIVRVYSLPELDFFLENYLADGSITLDEKHFLTDLLTSIHFKGYKKAYKETIHKKHFKNGVIAATHLLGLTKKQIKKNKFLIIPDLDYNIFNEKTGEKNE